MKEDKFDEIIKKKLDDLLPMKEADVWSSFADKLDQSNQLSDDEFDQLLDSKIIGATQNINAKYNSNHWHLLKEQLTIIEERKNTIFISKVLEFAAVFLIVFTFFHISGVLIDKKDTTHLNAKPEYAIIDNQNESISIQNLELQSYSSTLAPEKKVGINQSKQSIVSLNAVKTSNPSELIKKDPQSYDQSSVTEGIKEHSSIAENTHKIGEQINYLSESDQIIGQEIEQSIDQNTSNDGSIFSHDDLFFVDKPSINNSSIDLLPQISNSLVESEMPLMMPLKMAYPKLPAKVAVSIFGSADINLINTPFDKLYSLASYNKEALNNSVGVNISRTTNHVEIETGLGYSGLGYQPKIIREAFGQQSEYYFEKSLNKISYDIVNIPLNIKYHFINQDNWSSYLMVGATLNLIVNTDYDITETLRQGRPSAGRFTPDQARLTEKPFIKGFLNGDSFRENYFATIGFGFGIEKKVFKNTSLYIQPSYHRQFISDDIGIGPNKDKIHTSSLQFGVKTVIN